MNKCAVVSVLLAIFAFACNEQPVAVSRATVGAEPAMQASAPAPAVTGGFDGGLACPNSNRNSNERSVPRLSVQSTLSGASTEPVRPLRSSRTTNRTVYWPGESSRNPR